MKSDLAVLTASMLLVIGNIFPVPAQELPRAAPKLPGTLIPSPQYLEGNGIIVAFSGEKRDVIWGFSRASDQWTAIGAR